MTNTQILEQIERNHKEAISPGGTFINQSAALCDLTEILEIRLGFRVSERSNQVRIAHYDIMRAKFGSGRYPKDELAASFEIALKKLKEVL